MIDVVRWDITGKCNMACKHCQASKFYMDKKNNDLSLKDVCTIIDRLAVAGVHRVALLGGEPLIREDIIEILEYLKKKNILVTLNTNLMLLQKFDVKKLLELLQGVNVSLDGTNSEEHDQFRNVRGGFEKTYNNILELQKYRDKQFINISMVINKYNANSVENIQSLVEKLKIDNCLIDVVNKIGNADENWEEIALTRQEVIETSVRLITSWNFKSNTKLILRYCSNAFRDYLEEKTGIRLLDKYVWDAPGKTSFYITNDGILYPSHVMAYQEKKRFFKSQSLVEHSMSEILENSCFKEFLSYYELDLPRTYYETCKECKYCGTKCYPSPIGYWFHNRIPIDVCGIQNKKNVTKSFQWKEVAV